MLFVLPGAVLIILSATLALLGSLAFRRMAAIRRSSDLQVAHSAENWGHDAIAGPLDSVPSLLGGSELQRPKLESLPRKLWFRLLQTYYFDVCSICGTASSAFRRTRRASRLS